MKNKTVLVISAFVTVFLLTVGIGVVTNVMATNNQPTAVPTVDTSIFVQREQAYQQIINEANARIVQANEQITTLVNLTATAPAPEPTPVYLFSVEQASALAQLVAGIAPKELPTLVSFSGTPAYEVIYGNGNLYIDANTGSILYNGLQKAAEFINSSQAVAIAKAYLNNNSFTSVNFGQYNEAKVYVVSFSDGRNAYVDLKGNILAIQMPSVSSGSAPAPSSSSPAPAAASVEENHQEDHEENDD
ncbi:MAG: hypothetical protein NTZ74_13695 [Chloroflexi bacterium]|nr:hypothetical protein [Chloroflexota bacterium]